MPFPNSKWLELTYITSDNSKLYETNLKEKKLFKNYPSNFFCIIIYNKLYKLMIFYLFWVITSIKLLILIIHK
jgi:hypothetical protein